MKNDFEHQQEWWCPYSREQLDGTYACELYVAFTKKCDGQPGFYELCHEWRRQEENRNGGVYDH